MKRNAILPGLLSLAAAVVMLCVPALAAPGSAYTGAAVDIPQQAGKLATLVVNGVVTPIAGNEAVYTAEDGATVTYTGDLDAANGGHISSFAAGGMTEGDNDYAYRAAAYITAAGLQDDLSVSDAVTSGTVDAAAAAGVTITSGDPGFNGIFVSGVPAYTISQAAIRFDTRGDGSKTCDFSGLGAAVAAYGAGTKVTVADSDISVSGVANLALFCDSGANVTVRNSTLESLGGTLYAGYKNTPSQDTMVAPPWVLGMMGTSRCANLMGDNATVSVLDSDVSAAKWAVLSADSGSNMKLNVVNTTMNLTGYRKPLQADGTFNDAAADPNPYTDKSGSGTYAAGNADELFRGVTMHVGTYATIFAGGSGTYTDLEVGKSYDLLDAGGNVTETYTAEKTAVTVIRSDTFGFLIYQGDNDVTLENGTRVNSANATFLLQDAQGTNRIHLSGGVALKPTDGVLIQVMDSDDATTGMDAETSCFHITHEEAAGWPSETGSVSGKTPETEAGAMGGPEEPGEAGGPEGAPPDAGGAEGAAASSAAEGAGVVDIVTVDDTALAGDIYNGSGYYGQAAVPLEVHLGRDATLRGVVAETETVHIGYGSDSRVVEAGTSAADVGQITAFSIAEYYNIGHVANRYYSNGGNVIALHLTDNAVWTVSGESTLSSLSIAGGAAVKPIDGYALTMTVDGQETDIAPGDYAGAIRLTLAEQTPPADSEGASAAEPAEPSPTASPTAAPVVSRAPAEPSADETNAGMSTLVLVAILVAAALGIGAIVFAVLRKRK